MNENTATSLGNTGAKTPAKRFGIQFLQKWKLLPICGAVIGATIGCVYFFQLPNQYKAIAQIQIDSASKENATLELSEFKSSEVLRNRWGLVDMKSVSPRRMPPWHERFSDSTKTMTIASNYYCGNRCHAPVRIFLNPAGLSSGSLGFSLQQR